jgi:predicted nucleic acid-binding protein
MSIYEKSGSAAIGGATATPPGPRGYLDTNLIIGLAEDDLGASEGSAMVDLLQRHKRRAIRLFTSHVAKDELARRSAGAGHLQSVIYLLLDDVPAIEEQFRVPPLLGSMALGSTGPLVMDEMFGKLREILTVDDARHVLNAARNGIDYFVTCDQDTILKRARTVEPIAGIRLRLPSQLVADLAAAESS